MKAKLLTHHPPTAATLGFIAKRVSLSHQASQPPPNRQRPLPFEPTPLLATKNLTRLTLFFQSRPRNSPNPTPPQKNDAKTSPHPNPPRRLVSERPCDPRHHPVLYS